MSGNSKNCLSWRGGFNTQGAAIRPAPLPVLGDGPGQRGKDRGRIEGPFDKGHKAE